MAELPEVAQAAPILSLAGIKRDLVASSLSTGSISTCGPAKCTVWSVRTVPASQP